MNLKNLLLSASLFLAVPLGAAIPPAERLLPDDTLLLVTVPDCDALRHAASQSPKWLLWNDPAMKPFHDRFMARCSAQFIGPLEQDLGVNLADYLDLPQGQCTFAVTRNGWDGVDANQFPGLLLLLDTKNHSDQLKTNLDLLRKKWTAAGKPIRTETIHGLAFSVLPLSTNDLPPTLTALLPRSQPVQELGRPNPAERPGEMVIAQYQSLLIVGNSLKAVEPVVSRLTGGGVPCLADNALFAADQTSQFRNAPVYYSWLNARALFGIIAQIPAAPPNPSAPSLFPALSPSVVLNASGLAGLKSICLSCNEAYEGTTLTFYLSVPEADRQGVFKMLATRAKEAGAPAFVPADAVKFWRWRLDSQTIWSELQKTMAGVSPNGLGTLNGVIDMANSLARQKDANFDLRKNLVANLGDDWLGYEKGPVGTTAAANRKMSRGQSRADHSGAENHGGPVGGPDRGARPPGFPGPHHSHHRLAGAEFHRPGRRSGPFLLLGLQRLCGHQRGRGPAGGIPAQRRQTTPAAVRHPRPGPGARSHRRRGQRPVWL